MHCNDYVSKPRSLDTDMDNIKEGYIADETNMRMLKSNGGIKTYREKTVL